MDGRPFTRRQMIVGLGTAVGAAAGCGIEGARSSGGQGRISRRATRDADGGTGADGGTPIPGALPGVNVLDFGAVGDGIADDGPAFQAAIDSMIQDNGDGGFLWVPPGKYKIVTQVAQNLSGGLLQRGNLIMQGFGTSSQLICATGPTADVFQFGNWNRVELRDLAFVAKDNVNGIDARRVVSVGSSSWLRLSACDFYGVRAEGNQQGFMIVVAQSNATVEDCNFYGCSAERGFVGQFGNGQLSVSDCVFIDINGNLNGLVYNKAGMSSAAYIRLAGGPWPPATQGPLTIERCQFDEGNEVRVVWLDPSGTDRMGRVTIRDCNVLNNSQIPFVLHRAESVVFEQLFFYARTGNANELIQLTECGDVVIRNLYCRKDPDVTVRVTCDAATRALRVLDSPTLDKIISDSPGTLVELQGGLAVIYRVDGPVVANTLVKASAIQDGFVTQAAAADHPSALIGVALDAGVQPGDYVRVVGQGQAVFIKSDGQLPITPGDALGTSDAAAGRAKPISGGVQIGRALSRADATPDALVTVQLFTTRM